jgi:hypothetical protein
MRLNIAGMQSTGQPQLMLSFLVAHLRTEGNCSQGTMERAEGHLSGACGGHKKCCDQGPVPGGGGPKEEHTAPGGR